MVTILQGDCRDVLKALPAASVNCCVTSPPYWGLRDYGVPGIGLEDTLEDWLSQLVAVFREVRRVLRDDGTIWVNLGDAYDSGTRASRCPSAKGGKHGYWTNPLISMRTQTGMGAKQLLGMPWRVAFSLQADGWLLRSDIIWHKPNTMPESVKDRPTKAHEYIFLLSKQERYFYDADAIKEPSSPDSHARYARGLSDHHKYADGGPGGQTIARSFEHMKERSVGVGNRARPSKAVPNVRTAGVTPKSAAPGSGTKANESFHAAVCDLVDFRNKRDVWTVATAPYKGSHFATFPPALITPCILAGCPIGGTVLDPFGGSGTTGEVAEANGRNSILIELNPQYVELAKRRTAQAGLFCESTPASSPPDTAAASAVVP
jgi:DNA modification methylase